MCEVLGCFVVVLPRSVALVELYDDEDHDRYHCKDDGEIYQKGCAYAKDLCLVVVVGWRGRADLVRRRRVGNWRW